MEDWPRHKDNCVPVMIAEVGEKGLVAARDIKMGEQILIDSAVISVKRTEYKGALTRKFARSFRDQIQALPEEKASQFHNLKSLDIFTFPERDLKTARKENCLGDLKIFLSNRIQVEKEEDVLFFVLSLINHSCSPNVEECPLPRESEDQEKVDKYELRAVKDISKGEEITIFYLQSIATISPKQIRQRLLLESFGVDCKCCACSFGDNDDQDRISEKIAEFFLSPDAEVFLTFSSAKKYDTSLDDWKRMSVKGGLMLALSQKLHIGSVKIKKSCSDAAAQAAQMARDPVLLQRAMDAWEEVVMKTGFEKFKVEYEGMKEAVTKWAPQFDSKKPPTKEEITAFYDTP